MIFISERPVYYWAKVPALFCMSLFFALHKGYIQLSIFCPEISILVFISCWKDAVKCVHDNSEKELAILSLEA